MGNVSSVDLNLLVALAALLEERNLTRAGEKTNMSQPAMSGALARLRRHFDDELLVRDGREYRLTPLAARLLPEVHDALRQVERTLDARPEFVERSRLAQGLIPISFCAVPPRMAMRSSSLRPGVDSTRSTSVAVHGNG